ncbi:conserved hypothetical protein [Gloeothece citriformis PCC 7424]|uniref:Pepco domain-containing protein n=1 Tax=Gloeothece citriformis (strain PCC 7424) TaxID=65393 RepID=B7KJQ9_GLOC7|nr:hypothetical protein [Gloeothece citriformis]ACK69508.1 conserved hypothetical protein [Gloeothece citriformis PCC 7424]
MPDNSDETIWIITADETSVDGAKSATPYQNPYAKTPQTPGNAAPVQASKLETELSKFLSVVGKVFNHAQEQVNQQTGLKLDEIELTVEITAEGEVKLLGTGAKTATKGGITFKFKRE